MLQALKLHPNSRCDAVERIDVDIMRSHAGNLVLTYFLHGDITGLRLPAVTKPARVDELWRHTCFEAFLRAHDSDEYVEFNFSPSTEWAAYRFSSYRSGMNITGETAPQIEPMRGDAFFELQVRLTLDGHPGLPAEGPWHLGLSAAIEEVNGRKSYWALAHPVDKPDFHHSDCFALALPAPSRP